LPRGFSFEIATCAAAKATGLSRRMNRIVERFARLKGEKAFIVYIGAGDPNLDSASITPRWMRATAGPST